MFRNQTFLRSVSAVTLCTFMSLSMYPLTAAAQAHDAAEKSGLLKKLKDEGLIGNAQRYFRKVTGNYDPKSVVSSDERLGQLLNEIHEDLKAAVPDAAMPPKTAQAGQNRNSNGSRKSTLSDTDVDAKVVRIRSKTAEIKDIYADIDQGFKDTEKRLRDGKLPQEILDRHNVAVAQYQNRKAEFTRLIGKVENAADKKNKADRDIALADLGTFMAKYPNAKPHQYTDPNNLPFRTPDSKARKPYTTKAQFQASLFPPKYQKVMLAGAIPDGLKLAQATLPETPVPADTAETEDVQITQGIRDQAAALQNNPVKIYNWVRNNIAFIPSYGSIQGSDMTLQNKRGNAFDTASLLIALYRAAGIPARYVYGTIEVPADKAMNWVGGVTTPEAAQSLLGQGGIPNVGMVAGGKVGAIQMEHVWVEAFVDFVPSRGAVNRAPNTWIPMDASFKQYQVTQGINITSAVPFNAPEIVAKGLEGATISPDGAVKNLNQQLVQTALQDYQTQVQTYLSTAKPDATLEDVFGKRAIIQNSSQTLSASSSYSIVAIGSRFQSISANFRHKISINLIGLLTDVALGNSSLDFELSLAALNSRRLAVSYVPATSSDAQLIESYKVQGAMSLPVYLVKVKPTIQIDGIIVASGGGVTMGQTQQLNAMLSNPNSADNYTHSFTVVAGDELVLSVNGNGISQEVMRNRSNAFTSNTASENLHQIALTYWMEFDILNGIAAQIGKVSTQRLASIGLFSSPLTVHYYYGIPTSGFYKTRTMDVSRSLVAAAADQPKDTIEFQRQAGRQGSYLEGKVFEQLLGQHRGWGLSTVQLFLDANSEGIPIHRITASNVDAKMLQITTVDEVKEDILNAVTSGKIVLIPERNPMHSSWQGTAYIIEDPETGAGAYLLQGGSNGGAAVACAPSISPLDNIIRYFVIAIAVILLIGLIIAYLPELAIAAAAVPALVADAAVVIATAFAAFALYGLALPANAAGDDCSCAAHLGRCLDTHFADIFTGPNQSENVCSACFNACSGNNGNWPDTIPIFGGGPLNLTASCNYPGR